MSDNYHQHACAYARMGYPVFPLVPHTKVPIIEHGCNAGTTDLAMIDRWWSRWPDANIGIATVGLVVFDKDPDGDEWLQDNFDILEPAPRQTTPRKGAHFVFRQNGHAWRNSAGTIARGVDVRADGGYIVAAPSEISEKGVFGSYRWCEGYELTLRDELPEIPPELTEQLKEAAKRPTPVPNEFGKIARSGRHDYIRDRIYEARQALMPREIARRIALIANEEMCDPPIELDRDFNTELDRLLDWVYKMPVEGLPTGADSGADQAIEAAAIRQLRHSTVTKAGDYLRAIERVTRSTADIQMPAELLDDLPPVAQAAFEYYRDGFAYKVQPELWLGSIISLTSTLISHRVYLPDRTRPNIYCLGVAGTGRGKEATRQWCKHLLVPFGLSGAVDSGRITSMSGIFTSLAQQNPICLCPDEFGMVISQAVDPGQNARYAETIVQGFLELYSSSSNPHYQLTNYADAKKRHEPIAYPCVSVWAVTTPKTLWQKLSSGAIEAGLIPRFLFFNESAEPAESTPRGDIETPELLADWVNHWRNTPDSMLAQKFAPGEAVDVTAEARDVLNEFRRHCEVIVDDDDPKTLCWSRATQNAAKLALVHSAWSVTDSSGSVVVDAQAAKWAVSVVEYSVGLVLRQIERYMVDNEADRVAQRFLELVRRHADADGWCKRRPIQIDLGTTKFNYAKQALLRSGQIEIEVRQTKTKPGEHYRETDE